MDLYTMGSLVTENNYMKQTTDINAKRSTTTVYFWKKSLIWNIRSCARERRKRYNHELYQLYWSPDIVRTTKAAGLWWTGQLQRMGNNDTPKRSPGSHADSIHHCYHNVKMESHYYSLLVPISHTVAATSSPAFWQTWKPPSRN